MTRFGMFSDAGNAMIQGVVLTAKSNNLDWDQVVDVYCSKIMREI